ncbi:MAG: HAMP domain-containing sensor histidine kinase [Verrucomicrobiota bacterium]
MSSKPSKEHAGLNISLRLSLFYGGLFLIGYVAIFATGEFFITSAIEKKERAIVLERINEYRAWFLGGSTTGLRLRFEEQSSRSADLLFVRILGPGTNTILFSSPTGQELIDVTALDQLAKNDVDLVRTITTTSPRNVWTVGTSSLPRGFILQAGKISTPEFRVLNTFRRTLLWALIPVAILALGGGAFLAYRAMKPARELTATARTILETGRLTERVPTTHPRGDLAEMSDVFNRMLDRNEALIQAMHDALDNVSHDLRTPMTRLRAAAETALADPDNPEAAREALGDCLEESDRLLTMLNTLMDVAEAETGVMHLNKQPVDLTDLVCQVVDLYEFVAEEKRITVQTKVPESLEITADAGRLQQAIANLLDNALKYSSENGTVTLAMTKEDTFAVLRIADNGIGVAPEDLPRIWDRLYRGDRSRSERGLGLGLSFVRAIVQAHNGTVSAESSAGNGATFTLRVPIS